SPPSLSALSLHDALPICPTDIFAGGTITVGTQQVIIPRNLLLELPANRITLWQFARLSHVSGLAAEGHSSTTIFANRLPDGRVKIGRAHVCTPVTVASRI